MRRHADIFVEASQTSDLTVFAAAAFAILAGPRYEERHSSNHFGGLYFIAEFAGAEVQVMYADHPGLEAYAFWISLDGDGITEDQVTAISKRLAVAGWPCFVPSVSWPRKEWDGSGVRHEVQQAVAADGHAPRQ